MSERSIFLAALEIDGEAALEAYLDRECRDDPALRRRIQDLLRAHLEARSFMERPPASFLGDPTPGTTENALGSTGPVPGATGTLLAGRYLVGEEIGRGGMGTVYRAEQVAPVRRPVAVKLINPGMDSRSVLLRFEAERQALAVMDHPHIAKVLDAGAAPDGRPFFVMELVAGDPLTDYCDDRKLPMADRLDLFRQICGAVQHAHQKGIIHRDIKPSNLLVEEHGGVPTPKVIDFGLAKAIGGDPLTEQTLLTAPGSVAGTPLYMAPEQAGPDARDVDTRADVYALGAVLYELLTGSPPFGREAMHRAALHEMLRVIREDDPPPPSSRLGSSVDLPAVAINRRTEPARLGRFVRGDLDWVVMKALDKDRGRRYESAAAFGADVERFLNHEPVSAGSPGLRYRAAKLIRRNRAAVTVAAVVLLALVAGVVGTTLGLVEARNQRDAADLARRAEAERAEGERRARLDAQAAAAAERAAREAEVAQRRAAVEEAANAGAVRDFLLDDLLLQSDPAFQSGPNGPDKDVKVRTLLDRASTRLPGPFGGRPLLEGSVRFAVGRSYSGLGEYGQAVAHLTLATDLIGRARGPAHVETIRSAMALAGAITEQGKFPDAQQRLAALLPAARGAPDLPPEVLAELLLLLAKVAQYQQRPAEAEPFLAEAGAVAARLGDTHDAALSYAYQQSLNHFLLGRYAESEALAAETAVRCRKARGELHPMVMLCVEQVALCLNRQGKHAEAIEQSRGLASLAAKIYGPEHPTAETARFNLARALQDDSRWKEAEELYREILALHERLRGPNHYQTVGTLGYLAETVRASGRFAEAESLYRRALAGYKPGSRPRATIGAGLAACLIRLGRYADAETPLRECLATFEKVEPAGWRVALVRSRLGASLFGQRKYADAEPFLIDGYAGLRDRIATVSPSTLTPDDRAAASETAGRLVELYEALDRPEDVEKWRTERDK